MSLSVVMSQCCKSLTDFTSERLYSQTVLPLVSLKSDYGRPME